MCLCASFSIYSFKSFQILIFNHTAFLLSILKKTISKKTLQIDGYERYIEECERKENVEGSEEVDQSTRDERRKERQECLDMLKTELRRIQDGGDPYDFDYLLDDETRKLLNEDGNATTENKDDEEKDDDVSEKTIEEVVQSDDEPKKDK